MTVQRVEQPFGATHKYQQSNYPEDDALVDAEEEEEASSPNFNEYTNAMVQMHSTENYGGKKDLDFAAMSSSSPGQTNTVYPTTQMTTEDNEEQYTAEMHSRQNNYIVRHHAYQSSNLSSEMLHASPGAISNDTRRELPPLDDMDESQDSVVLQQSTSTSH